MIEAGGVGYGVAIPSRTAEALGPVGSEAALWVATHTSEYASSLYGFGSRGEREVFDVMLGISGVGPRMGLALLSTFSVEQIIQVALSADAQALRKVPGVGAKTAEKLLFELKGRVDRLTRGLAPSEVAALSRQAGAVEAFEPAFTTETAKDAVAALEALDIQAGVARRAISRAIEGLGPDAAVEELVREGLRHRHAV